VKLADLRKYGFKIEKIYLDDFTDAYTRKRHFGTAICVIYKQQIVAAYRDRKNLYAHLRAASRRCLTISELYPQLAGIYEVV